MNSATDASTPEVEIALATYNGARFLEEQLDSYLRQSFRGWGLLVRDDGSEDDTVERIRRHAGKHGYPLRFTEDSGRHAGYPETFYALLEQSRAEYVFFSDQDDLWLPDKLAASLSTLRALPVDRPAMVHTDLTVVDRSLEVTHPSYLRLKRLYPPRSTTVSGLLCWEYVTGCTMGLNARTRAQFRRPRAVAGHDAWLALTCAALGTVRFLDRPTVLYRQHGRNVVGAHNAASKGERFWRRSLAALEETNRLPLARADSLLECYSESLSPDAREEIEAFACLDRAGPISLLKLHARGALPAHPATRRRVLSVLTKMQLKQKALFVRSGGRRRMNEP